MRLLFIILMVVLPYAAFSQEFRIKIDGEEFPTDKIPEHVTLPDKVKKLTLKKLKADKAPITYVVQIGEEEHSFLGDGSYHDVEFSHDIRGLVVYILDDKRQVQGKPFILKKAK